jgi:hypothetical protein
MNRVRKAKQKFLGAVALSSTVVIGTAAVAGTAAGAILLSNFGLVQGVTSVKWSDVISVLTLTSTASASSTQPVLLGSATKITKVAAASTAQSAPAVPGVAPTKFGINLISPTYYEGSRTFMNLLAGEGWRLRTPQGSLVSMPADRLDANMRVVTLNPGEQTFRSLSTPTRAYRGESVDVICKWKGTGTVRIHGPNVKNVKTSSKSLTFTYVPSSGGGMYMTVGNISSSDPVYNTDCREADADPNAVFDPTFLSETSRYGVLRFMKWSYGGVESNQDVSWATRTTPKHDVIRGRDGIAIEHMIALANQLQADPWFSIPWNADDEYIRKFAELVKDKLDPKLTAYVEVSNEVWNYVYPVTHQALAEGKAAGLAANDGRAMLSRYAQKTGQVMDVWSSVFEGEMYRTVRVIAIQTGTWNAEVVLGYGDTAKKVDAIATAPYFGANLKADALDTPAGVDAVFADLSAKVTSRLGEAKNVKAVANKYGIRHITYEAGQHVLGSPPLDKMAALQRDPRMGALYTQYLTQWREEIGDLMVLFVNYGETSKYGSWGQREYVGQPLNEAPKENAVELFRRSYVTK